MKTTQPRTRYTELVSVAQNSTSADGLDGIPVDTSGIADGEVLIYDAATGTFLPGAASGSPIEVLDEGVSLTANLASLDFVGAGVTATVIGDAVTVTIPTGGLTSPQVLARTMGA